MRNLVITSLLSSALFFPIASHAEEAYLKLGVGESTYSGQSSKTATAGLIAYGWAIQPNIFAEVGYIDFGSASDKFNDPGNFSLLERIKTQSVYAAGISHVPLSSSLTLQGKLGVVVHNTNTYSRLQLPDETFSDDSSYHKTRLLIGAGLSTNFSKEISGVLEYTYFGSAINSVDLSLVSASLLYHF
jgi:hypothetical protein